MKNLFSTSLVKLYSMFRFALIASCLIFGGCASTFSETYEFSFPPISDVEIHDDLVVVTFNHSPSQWRRLSLNERLAIPRLLGIDTVLGCGNGSRPLILTVEQELKEREALGSQLDSIGESIEVLHRFDINGEDIFPIDWSLVGKGDSIEVSYRCRSDASNIGRAYNYDTIEEARVLAAVNEVVLGINESDLERKLSASRIDGTNFILRENEDGSHTIRGVPRARFFDANNQPTQELRERIWNTRVIVTGPMAVVFADYDFYIDGVLSHCGVNVYNLVNDENTWKVANMSYTVKRSGCEPTPLGSYSD